MVRCAVCKWSRKRKCVDNCAFVELFLAEDDVKFNTIASYWGLTSVKKQLLRVGAEQRPKLIESLHFEATWRSRDPVNGVYTYVRELEQEIARLKSELVSQNWFPQAPCNQGVPGQFAISNQPIPSPNPNNVQQHYNPPYNQVLNQPQAPYYPLQPNLQPLLGPIPNSNYVQQGRNSFPYYGVSNQPQFPNYQLQPNLQPTRGPFPDPNNVQQGYHPFPDHQVSNQPQVYHYQRGTDLQVNHPDPYLNQPTLPNEQPQGLNQLPNDLEAGVPDPPDANGPGVDIANEPGADAPVANDPEAFELGANTFNAPGDMGLASLYVGDEYLERSAQFLPPLRTGDILARCHPV